jgi:hypothetical protein
MKNNLQLKKFKKIPFAVAIVLLACSSVAFFVIYRATYKNVAESAELEKGWAGNESYKEEVANLQRFVEAYPTELTSLDSHFIKNPNVVPFLDLVESLGPKVGASTEVTQVDISKDGTSLTVGISADGSFESLYKFLKLLENSPFQLEVIAMNMQGNVTGGDNLTPNVWAGTFKVKLLNFLP